MVYATSRVYGRLSRLSRLASADESTPFSDTFTVVVTDPHADRLAIQVWSSVAMAG